MLAIQNLRGYDTTTVNVHGKGFLQLFLPLRRAWQGVPLNSRLTVVRFVSS
jgi:hypothetical protein